ncbi:MAG TPA: hypothetical protein VIX59_18305 [Candidatus Binataceae bacterium]
MENRMMKNSRSLADLLSLVGATALLWMAASGTAFASVPELDPGSSATGVAVLLGGTALLLERYRRR